MSWKNGLLKLLVKCFKRKENRLVSEERFLIISTTGLGDTLWATPALSALRKKFPKSLIAVLTSPLGREVLDENPDVDSFYVLGKPLFFHFFSLLKKLHRNQFTTIFIFHASQRLVFPLAALLGASSLIGSQGKQKGLDALLTDVVGGEPRHEIQRRLDLVARKGATASAPMRFKKVSPTRKGKWVILHPGAQDRYKRWPIEHFALLGRRLQENLSCHILITGNRKEASLMRLLTEKIPGAKCASPQLSLHDFARELAGASLLITNDTGPFHLAIALGKPALGLYVPTDPLLCGPFGPTSGEAIFRSPTCTPCLKRACRAPFCFFQIGVDEVLEKAEKLLR